MTGMIASPSSQPSIVKGKAMLSWSLCSTLGLSKMIRISQSESSRASHELATHITSPGFLSALSAVTIAESYGLYFHALSLPSSANIVQKIKPSQSFNKNLAVWVEKLPKHSSPRLHPCPFYCRFAGTEIRLRLGKAQIYLSLLSACTNFVQKLLASRLVR